MQHEQHGGGLDAGRFSRLTALMTRMAAGDSNALFELYDEFYGAIAGAVRREFRRLGIDRPHADDVAGLVLDACVDLFERAGSWEAAHGVLPWTWARFRIRALVGASVGQFAGALPEEGPAEAAAGAGAVPAGATAREGKALALLERLAGRLDELCLLKEGLDRVSRLEQQAILLEVKLQAALGDPSPAVTVGREAGMRPDAVRQTVKRVLDRLRRLADSEPHFAPLAHLHLLAA